MSSPTKSASPLIRLFAIPRWVLEWSLIVLFLAGIPYLVIFVLVPVDKHFTGILINPLDTNSYFADMQIGLRGEWLYTLPYSFQKNQPAPLFMFYIMLGHLARSTCLSIPLVFHLSRLFLGFILVILSFHYVSRFSQDEREQKLALFILLFTGGLGWLIIALFGARVDSFSIPDVWILEGITFGSILGFPHFVLSMILMLICLIAGQDWIRGKNWVCACWAIFAGTGIAFVHPQQLLVVGVVLFINVCLEHKNSVQKLLHDFGLLFIALFPGVIFAFLISQQSYRDPLLSNWLEQGNTLSPPLWSFFIMYGPVLCLAMIGVKPVLQYRKKSAYQVVTWFFVVLGLLYAPVNLQRRFIEGWHIPISILAAMGWFREIRPWLTHYLKPAFVRGLMTLVLLSVAISPIYLIAMAIGAGLNWNTPGPFFLDNDELGAVEYLRTFSSPDDVILASFENGNRLPAQAGVRSFAGHWSLTPFFKIRLMEVEKFFNRNITDEERIDLLKRYNIRYVYIGTGERELGDFAPGRSAYLQPVYRSGTVSLYQTIFVKP